LLIPLRMDPTVVTRVTSYLVSLWRKRWLGLLLCCFRGSSVRTAIRCLVAGSSIAEAREFFIAKARTRVLVLSY
jgi:hypothetical protein